MFKRMVRTSGLLLLLVLLCTAGQPVQQLSAAHSTELWHNVPNGDILAQISAPAVKAGDKPQFVKLVGAWNIDLTGPTHPPIPALLVFTSDGIVMGARPPLPFETPAYGNWISTGPQTAAFTFVTLTGSEKGPFTAKSKISGTVKYDAAKDSWRGPEHLDVYDPSGRIVFSDTGALSGTRIAVEPLK